MVDCGLSKIFILDSKPTNEWELIKECEKRFTGFSIKQKKNGKALVIGEFYEPETNKIGFITFTVPTCKTFFNRDKKGYIKNHNQFEVNV